MRKLCYRRNFLNELSGLLCLENKQEPYNNVLELFIHILIYGHQINNTYCFSCQHDNIHIKEKLKQVLRRCKIIIVPILHNSHFTFAFINNASNTFIYVDPIGNEEATLSQLCQKFKAVYNNNNACIAKTEVHDLQCIKKDNTNCGVFVCQFLERIAKYESLVHLTRPSDYRKRMKQQILQYGEDLTYNCLHCYKIDEMENQCSKCYRIICVQCVAIHYKE
ncbi:hypothetical protein GQX74_015649 [Glossina fuscipes]|nr:hypothetical protein GQX74_015649 [Glossina fuscipes]